MKKIYERIQEMKGNLITVFAENVKLGELARIEKSDGTTTYASALSFDGERVVLQVFGGTRGISTGDKVIFLHRQIEAIFSDSLLGRRLNGAGEPIDSAEASAKYLKTIL